MSDEQKLATIKAMIIRYGGIDGAHHKQWVLDQIIRTITGDGDTYDEWVRVYESGDDGPKTYEWDKGIAP